MAHLGFIPAWQFDYDTGPMSPTLQGLGFVPAWQFGYDTGPTPPTLQGVFDSWAWQNRKLIVLGGGAIIGLGVLGLLGAILK